MNLPISQIAAPLTLKLRARAYTPCMGNLEKLYWIDAFAVTGYGVRVGVRVNDAALIQQLRSRLPPGAKISPMGTVDRMLSVILAPPSERRGVKNYHLVYADHVVVGRSHRLAAVLGQLRYPFACGDGRAFPPQSVCACRRRGLERQGHPAAGKDAGGQDPSGRGARQGGRRDISPMNMPFSTRTEGFIRSPNRCRCALATPRRR